MLIFGGARGGENLGTGQKNPSQSARGLAQSKSWRPLAPAVNSRSVLDCASPLALSDDHEILVTLGGTPARQSEMRKSIRDKVAIIQMTVGRSCCRAPISRGCHDCKGFI